MDFNVGFGYDVSLIYDFMVCCSAGPKYKVNDD